MVYDGYSNADRDILKYYQKNNLGNKYFGIIIGDNDDGEEMPSIRLWWPANAQK